MGQEQKSYNVVFMGIGGPDSNHPGIITWTSYPSKAKFEELINDPNRRNKDAILAEDVTQEEAIAMARETTDLAYLTSAIAQSTNADGTIDMARLKFHLNMVQLMKNFRDGAPTASIIDLPEEIPPQLP